MPDVFISYSRVNSDPAFLLARRLAERGFDVWIDRRIGAGADWEAQLKAALEASHAVLLLWSKDAAQSRWVETEMNYALETGKLFPVFLDKSPLPERVAHLNFRSALRPGRPTSDTIAADLQNFILERSGKLTSMAPRTVRFADAKSGGDDAVIPTPKKGWSKPAGAAAATAGGLGLAGLAASLSHFAELGTLKNAHRVGEVSELGVAARNLEREAAAHGLATTPRDIDLDAFGRPAPAYTPSGVPLWDLPQPQPSPDDAAKMRFEKPATASDFAFESATKFDRFIFDLNPSRAAYRATLRVSGGDYTLVVERGATRILNERTKLTATFAAGAGAAFVGTYVVPGGVALIADNGTVFRLQPQDSEVVWERIRVCVSCKIKEVRDLGEGLVEVIADGIPPTMLDLDSLRFMPTEEAMKLVQEEQSEK